MGEEDDVNRKDIGKSASDSAQVIENVTGLIAGVHFPQLCGQQIISNFPSSMVSGQQVRASPMRANTGASQPPLRNVVAVPMIRQPNNMQFLMNSREIASSTSLIPLHTPYVLQGNSYVTVPQGHAPMNLIQIQGHPYMIPGNQMSYVQAPSTTLIQSSLASARSVKRDNKDHEETRDKLEIVDDSQELPPALDRVADEEEVDENKETTIGFNILDAFRKEAEQFKKIVDERGIFVHNINGCVIEESADPFPSATGVSAAVLNQNTDEQRVKEKSISVTVTRKEKITKLHEGIIHSPRQTDDKRRRSRRNELTQLLSMDFGPKSGDRILSDSKRRSFPEKEEVQENSLSRRRNPRRSSEYSTHGDLTSEESEISFSEMSTRPRRNGRSSDLQVDITTNSHRNSSFTVIKDRQEVFRQPWIDPSTNLISTIPRKRLAPCSCPRKEPIPFSITTCLICSCKECLTRLAPQYCTEACRAKYIRLHNYEITDLFEKEFLLAHMNAGTSSEKVADEDIKLDSSSTDDSKIFEIFTECLQDVHPYNWTVADTCQWVIKVTGSNDVANSLQIEDVDCLLLLSLSLKDLRDAPFNLKFGTARRIELALEKLCEEWKICNRFEEIDLPLTDKGPRLISVDDMYEMVYEATNDANIAARLRVEEINGEVLQHSTWDELRDLCITEIPLSFGTRKKMNRLEHFFNRLKARWSGLRRIC